MDWCGVDWCGVVWCACIAASLPCPVFLLLLSFLPFSPSERVRGPSGCEHALAGRARQQYGRLTAGVASAAALGRDALTHFAIYKPRLLSRLEPVLHKRSRKLPLLAPVSPSLGCDSPLRKLRKQWTSVEGSYHSKYIPVASDCVATTNHKKNKKLCGGISKHDGCASISMCRR